MRTLPFLLLLPLAACTVGPDYQRPVVSGDTGNWIGAVPVGQVDLEPWRRMNDSVLVALIETGAAANLDVRQAEARLREARAGRDAVRGGTGPQVNATGSATTNRLSENGQLPIGQIPGFKPEFNLFDAGFDASWEIDLWGGNRRAVEAAGRRAQAAEAQRNEVRLQVVAEIARTYGELRGAQAQLAIIRSDAESQRAIAGLIRQRYQSGEAARLDDARADAAARTAEAAIPGLEADIRAATYRLALLTGRPPEAWLDRLSAAAPLPVPPALAVDSVRSDVLRRRPDVAAAEAKLAAATSDVGTETANLFPRFSLLGSIGRQAREPGDLFSLDSTRFQFGPSLRWPIFSMGRVRAQIRGAEARADSAAIDYERAVLGALSDSETALNRYASAQLAVRELEGARSQAATALELSRQRFRAGEDDRLTLLDAQTRFNAADRAASDARTRAFLAYVALTKALGGGWATA